MLAFRMRSVVPIQGPTGLKECLVGHMHIRIFKQIWEDRVSIIYLLEQSGQGFGGIHFPLEPHAQIAEEPTYDAKS